MNCPICSKPIEIPTTGRPKAFCSPACRLKAHRSKSPTSTPPTSLAAKLSSMVLKQAKSPINPNKYDVYMPTQNDANIAALTRHGANATLPYPDHNSVPLHLLPPVKLAETVQPVTFSDQPTF